jgi:hypothetical protein
MPVWVRVVVLKYNISYRTKNKSKRKNTILKRQFISGEPKWIIKKYVSMRKAHIDIAVNNRTLTRSFFV